MSDPRRDITPGSRWRQIKLGSEAVYEVIAVGDQTVEVAVHAAPGLEPGTRLRLLRESLEEMEPVTPRAGSRDRSADGREQSDRG
jgi:hypothetical protein